MNFLRTKLVEYVMAKGLKSVIIDTASPEGLIQFTLKHTVDKGKNEISRKVFVDFQLHSDAKVTINIRGRLGAVENIFFASNTFYVDPYFRLSRYLEVVFYHIYSKLYDIKGKTPSRKYHSEDWGTIDYFEDSDIFSIIYDLMKSESVLERGRDNIVFKNEEYKKAINRAINFAKASERNILIEEDSSGSAIRATPYPHTEDKSKTFECLNTDEGVFCNACIKRGKHWQGSDPKCAFDEKGNFTSDNWNCATLSKLREIAEDYDLVQTANETSIATLYVPSLDLDEITESDNFDAYGGFIVLSWYKNRGNTGNALFMSEEGTLPLSIKHAERFIAAGKYGDSTE